MTAEVRVDIPQHRENSPLWFWVNWFVWSTTNRAELCKDPHNTKEKIIFLARLPWVGSGHNDPKISCIWAPDCSSELPSFPQHFPLTSSSLWLRVRNENFLQTCCEKSKSGIGRWENLQLSWLTLAVFVQAAFVISWWTSSVVLYTPNLHRRHALRANYFEHSDKDSLCTRNF